MSSSDELANSDVFIQTGLGWSAILSHRHVTAFSPKLFSRRCALAERSNPRRDPWALLKPVTVALPETTPRHGVDPRMKIHADPIAGTRRIGGKSVTGTIFIRTT